MKQASGETVLEGLWRFAARHPEWTEDEGGAEGWEPNVGWWAVDSTAGLLLVDPLVTDWAVLDRLVDAQGGCGGILRTCHWHQRSIAEAAGRYGCEVWAKPPPDGVARHHYDHPTVSGLQAVGGVLAFDVERGDEIALWLPGHHALAFGDAMLRRDAGALMTCPPSWLQPEGGPARLRAVLAGLLELPIEHVLVSHGPLVLGGGAAALRAAIA